MAKVSQPPIVEALRLALVEAFEPKSATLEERFKYLAAAQGYELSRAIKVMEEIDTVSAQLSLTLAQLAEASPDEQPIILEALQELSGQLEAAVSEGKRDFGV